MTEDDLIAAILSVSLFSEAEARALIDRPIETSGLDSLDFEMLRAALEKRLGRAIDDAVWQESGSLRELLAAL